MFNFFRSKSRAARKEAAYRYNEELRKLREERLGLQRQARAIKEQEDMLLNKVAGASADTSAGAAIGTETFHDGVTQMSLTQYTEYSETAKQAAKQMKRSREILESIVAEEDLSTILYVAEFESVCKVGITRVENAEARYRALRRAHGKVKIHREFHMSHRRAVGIEQLLVKKIFKGVMDGADFGTTGETECMGKRHLPVLIYKAEAAVATFS